MVMVIIMLMVIMVVIMLMVMIIVMVIIAIIYFSWKNVVHQNKASLGIPPGAHRSS